MDWFDEADEDPESGEPLLQEAGEQRRRFRFTVEKGDGLERLDRFLAVRLHPSYSRSYLAEAIREGCIRVNGRTVAPSHTVAVGEGIEALLGAPADETPGPEAIPLRILYEDEGLIVLDKPPFLLVHPGAGRQRGTLVNGLLHRFPELCKVGLVFRPGLVHRLDRDTSGVMVVARTNDVRERLTEQFRDRQVKKQYLAVVVGKVPLHSDYIDLPIGKNKKHPERMAIDLKEGKPASTFYEVVERLGGFTLVRVHPLSGRTHQIRVHLKQIGFPLVMDPLYGRETHAQYLRFCEQSLKRGARVPSIRRQALHAHRIRFVHPVDGRQMEFEAPLPADISELIEILRDAVPAR